MDTEHNVHEENQVAHERLSLATLTGEQDGSNGVTLAGFKLPDDKTENTVCDDIPLLTLETDDGLILPCSQRC